MRSTVGALVTNYSVNGLGQHVAKRGPAGQVEYYYDLAGHLLGSYGVAAAVREEIVWLGDLPIATLQGGATYPIAPDHVGTPYKIVNAANSEVWYWDHHPFGETLGITTVAGFRYELRFPGHIYDSETGLFNNGFRDYWPFIGRYIESDPIGIAGGIGTYSYAGNNPVNAIDPFGLDPKVQSDALPDISVAGQQYAQVIERDVFPVRTPASTGRPVTLWNNVTGRSVTIPAGTNLEIVPPPGWISSEDLPKGETYLESSRNERFVVDSRGNAIPLNKGEYLTRSPDGKWVQVRDPSGSPTGMRIDGPHGPRTHPDARAQQPHAHVPGASNPDGTPWLPIR